MSSRGCTAGIAAYSCFSPTCLWTGLHGRLYCLKMVPGYLPVHIFLKFALSLLRQICTWVWEDLWLICNQWNGMGVTLCVWGKEIQSDVISTFYPKSLTFGALRHHVRRTTARRPPCKEVQMSWHRKNTCRDEKREKHARPAITAHHCSGCNHHPATTDWEALSRNSLP